MTKAGPQHWTAADREAARQRFTLWLQSLMSHAPFDLGRALDHTRWQEKEYKDLRDRSVSVNVANELIAEVKRLREELERVKGEWDELRVKFQGPCTCSSGLIEQRDVLRKGLETCIAAMDLHERGYRPTLTDALSAARALLEEKP